MKHMLQFCVVVLFLALLPLVGTAQIFITTQLTANQEIPSPATATTATGTGSFILNADMTELRYNITVCNLTGPITAAHFHKAAPGQSGSPVRTIIGDFVGNTAAGVWKSTDAQPLTENMVKEILRGNIYVNVHTAANPGGEIRGQLGERGFTAKLDTAQEIASIKTTSSGVGSASFSLDPAMGKLTYSVTICSLSGPITAAHFHKGAPGVNGLPVKTITGDFNGNTASGIWSSTDTEPLTSSLVNDLLAGNLYINVHTTANPNGEIRGQVVLDNGIHFATQLTSKQEFPTPPVVSSGTGTAVFSLNDSLTALSYSVTVFNLTGPITGAHFHKAAPGVSGGVIRAITSDFVGNKAVGTWRSTDSQPLTPSFVTDLLMGKLYVNVHTSSNPGGEIRGQIGERGFTAQLDTSQEKPSVSTLSSGTGTASFILSPTLDKLQYFVTVTGITGPITAAHIHKGIAGVSGSPVKTLTGNFTGKTASGVWKSTDSEALTDSLISDLLAGNLYVNVHTAANAGGEIRGQILLDAGKHLTTQLTANQETSSLQGSVKGTGTAAFSLNDSMTALSYRITVDSLTGPITGAHFHKAAPGVSGGVIRAITSDFVGNTATGTWRSTDSQPLTNDLVTSLLKGHLYVNVHTSSNPGGEIRGQIGDRGFSADPSSTQEVPALNAASSGGGVGAFSFNPAMNRVRFNITVTNLTGTIAAAHIHRGAPGVSGSPVKTITGDFNGNTASGIWKRTDSEALTDTLITDLLAGNLYVNVHTAGNPNGEIRGQINMDKGFHITTQLSDDQEVPYPSASTMGTGTGSFTLNDSSMTLDYAVAVDNLTGTITAAHFHKAAPGASGGPVRTIVSDFKNNVALGTWRSTDSQPFTTDLMKDLLNGNIYVNVHTAANSGGEIRGQLGDRGFSAKLDTAHEAPAPSVKSSGTGTATVTLNPAMNELRFDITVCNLTGSITGAHFHRGAAGVPGPVVKAITTDFTGNTASGVWKATDTQALTDSLVADLLAGRLYVNVHTASNPGGEIRGQVFGLKEILTTVGPAAQIPVLPTAFDLLQNYPNPFNPETFIRYNLSKQSNVVLKIYNILGQDVRTLVQQKQDVGLYEMKWDARDNQGTPVASGVYLYQLRAGDFVKIRKMVLLR